METKTHRHVLARIPPAERARLTRRSDSRGLAHLAGHLGLIALLAAPIALEWPGWWLFLWPLGVALAFLFTLQHECTHRTPFARSALNEALGHLTGLVLIQPFLWFRTFHMAHHKHTNDPARDPELQDDRPGSIVALLWHLSSITYWAAKVRVLVENARGDAQGGFLSARQTVAVRREARIYLALYAALLVAMVSVAPLLFWLWLLPLALGFPVLLLYLLAEHDRCPQVANMLANSRTTLTSAPVRFLAWNMPYHAEHHAWPDIPFHALPALHRLIAEDLQSVTPGYVSFTRETVAAYARRRLDEGVR